MAVERVCALIVAAGRGVRFGATENKVFARLAGRPLLGWTLAAFAQAQSVDDIVIVGTDGEQERLRPIADEYGGGKVREIVAGGSDRQASVYNGLRTDTARAAAYVAIHDAARPCITPALIGEAVRAAVQHGAVTLAVPVTDTLVRGMGAKSDEAVSRDGLYAIQTPQVFGQFIIENAHETALRYGVQGTDDAGLVRGLHRPITYVPGSPENLKITRPEDLRLAEAILTLRTLEAKGLQIAESQFTHGSGSGAALAAHPNTQHLITNPFPSSRIGHGYDVHPFADNRPLWLGGVHFPDATRGMQAHSDGDVILHALCDALLGAAGLGDIGKLFPPSDMRHKDRPSREFLQEVAERLTQGGWHVGNVDITVLAEYPKIGPRADEMKRVISAALDLAPEAVNIKATTNEGMGFVGRGEGIAVHATALIFRQ